MPYVRRSFATVLMLSTLVGFSACSPKSQVVDNYSTASSTAGLKLDQSASPTLLYKRIGAPGLGAYKRFIIDPVQVIYSDPGMMELEPEDVGRMQKYFRDAMIKELREGGYQVGTRSQAGTLRVSIRDLGS